MIDFAQVADLAQGQSAHTVAIVSAIGAVALQSWRNRIALMNLLDDFKTKNATAIANLSIKMAQIDTQLKNTRSSEECERRMNLVPGIDQLRNVVREECDGIRKELVMYTETRDKAMFEVVGRLKKVEERTD